MSRANTSQLVGAVALCERSYPNLLLSDKILRLAPNEKVFAGYLARVLRTASVRGQIEAHATGTSGSMCNISQSTIRGLVIPLPPLPEQQRIARILDAAETLRAKRRATLAELDGLTHAIFIEMFGEPGTNPNGFPTKPLADLIRAGDTINYGVVQPGDESEDGIPLVRVGDLLDGRVRLSSLKRISPEIEAAYRRSRLRGDEILVSCVGSIGVVVMADASVKGFNIARAVARIRLADNVDRTFCAEYLKTDFVQRYFTVELRTVSQPTLNIKQIAETKVVLPPLALQQTFASRIAAVERLKSALRASLAELDALFAALQHRAFRGEL